MPDYDFAFDLNYTIDEQLSLTQDQGLSDEIHHILKGLTGRQKEIIYLRFVHEMSFEEISEIMENHFLLELIMMKLAEHQLRKFILKIIR